VGPRLTIRPTDPSEALLAQYRVVKVCFDDRVHNLCIRFIISHRDLHSSTAFCCLHTAYLYWPCAFDTTVPAANKFGLLEYVFSCFNEANHSRGFHTGPHVPLVRLWPGQTGPIPRETGSGYICSASPSHCCPSSRCFGHFPPNSCVASFATASAHGRHGRPDAASTRRVVSNTLRAPRIMH
jgi:hypothetical protein